MAKNMARVEMVLVSEDGGMDEAMKLSMRDIALIADMLSDPKSPAESEIKAVFDKALAWLSNHGK